jgi:uncharacterized protein YqiB (DUF1249 family)
MLVRDRQRAIEYPKPLSFAALMEMYEVNYLRLRLLCPALSSMPDRAVSRADGALDLHLDVLERSVYTTTLRLTYLFEHRDPAARRSPDLEIRVYHDARQAEVLRRAEHGRVIEAASGRAGLELKWRLNRFLYKWLGYCRHQGHCFPNPVTQPDEA